MYVAVFMRFRRGPGKARTARKAWVLALGSLAPFWAAVPAAFAGETLPSIGAVPMIILPQLGTRARRVPDRVRIGERANPRGSGPAAAGEPRGSGSRAVRRLTVPGGERKMVRLRPGGPPTARRCEGVPPAWGGSRGRLRFFAVDVVACPRCGDRMRVVATIADPAVVQRVLDHFGLASAPVRSDLASGEPHGSGRGAGRR
jgi:hypothetical protein